MSKRFLSSMTLYDVTFGGCIEETTSTRRNRKLTNKSEELRKPSKKDSWLIQKCFRLFCTFNWKWSCAITMQKIENQKSLWS